VQQWLAKRHTTRLKLPTTKNAFSKLTLCATNSPSSTISHAATASKRPPSPSIVAQTASSRPEAAPSLAQTASSPTSASNNDDIEMSDNGVSRTDKIRTISTSAIRKCLQQGYRICQVTKKFKDPKLQFFDHFLKDQGFPGIGEEDVPALKQGRQLKRPGQSSRLPSFKAPVTATAFDIWKPRETADPTADKEGVVEMERAWEETPLGTYRFVNLGRGAQRQTDGDINDVTDMFHESRIGSEIEDDATKAVREALEGYALGAFGAGG
jgi:hypothetical protein